ncbi:MAG: porin, partial [Paracoccaceae bacterium]|nr:porin [Paracoccaceae bacterium]
TMKKLLIATTAIIATAGMAAADVKVGGNGRMGVVYDGNDLQFSSRIRIAFTASGETDGGLAFGGSIRADNSSGGAAGNDGSVYISGAFGKLEMGDTPGAAEVVIGNLPEVGYSDPGSNKPAVSNLGSFNVGANDTAFLTGDEDGLSTTASGNPVVLYQYSTGAFLFAASFNDGTQAAFSGPKSAFGADLQEYSVGVKYTFGDYTASLGYEVADPTSAAPLPDTLRHLIVGGSAKFADTTVNAYYGDGSGGLNGYTHYGLGVSSKFDAITVKGYVKRQEWDAASPSQILNGVPGLTGVTSYGLGADYALGGGATVSGGIVDNNLPGSDLKADLGIKFTF